ncbi:MAG TPA: transcription termination factor Rho [Mycobacterium sp.]|uniref:transcription termination factor Rho n=1 Tax=Mycobacterium sp. TaxID=1785 RepID=UPI002D26A0AA|nr:transcription termination factor Rho [Mycobacterium sp.]HZU50137.1 transcription termination factor Rho [Mycobacterium sp.]
MTDTDLITAGDSTNDDKLSSSVTSDTSAPTKAGAAAPTAVDTDLPDGSLSAMVLPELRALANRAGVKGTSGMRKNELIAAIREIHGQANGRPSNGGAAPESGDNSTPEAGTQVEAPRESTAAEASRRERRTAGREAGSPTATAEPDTQGGKVKAPADAGQQDTKEQAEKSGEESDQQGPEGQQSRSDDDGEGRQGRRGRRFRDRRRRGERAGDGTEPELREDDVLQPVAGILDVLDNYAFVRTSGYLAGPHDVYVSMNMVRKNGLRRGDAVTGAVRVPREGEQPNQRQKFNPLVRLDSVNGGPVEDAKKRPDFGKLTPLYPNQRLRLETSSEKLTTRVIDLIMPIGKGQRALIVSPPKAGKTTILKDTANAITKNNPECHLMVVLVDERPEEVTDMQRSVKGEVIASTFDRPPSDHTTVAELAIERAKRLVEQGQDVVVLLDSITRLGRAYNNASPASGRILSGGVDSTALYPPKRFLGAARNIEEGGSLTVIATAMVETGSQGDTVIFEEFKGTGNAELKLDRKIAERRVFPAVDVNPSGTRKDELLLSPDEFAIVHKLRRLLSGLDSHQAIDLLMSQLRKTKNNYEFLVQVSKTTPGMDTD